MLGSLGFFGVVVSLYVLGSQKIRSDISNSDPISIRIGVTRFESEISERDLDWIRSIDKPGHALPASLYPFHP